jgi:hypothetical protein
VLVVVELDRAVLVIVIVDVTVAATVPENTVAAGGVTVLVWTISTVFVSVIVEAGARTVCTTAGVTVCVTVVVRGPSGPSRLARAARRASLAERAAPRRLCCLAGLVEVGEAAAWEELLSWTLAACLVASACFGEALVVQ